MNVYLRLTVFLVLFFIKGGEGLSSNLDDLKKEFGAWLLKRSPEYSTLIGVYKYNDRVEDFSYDRFQNEYNKYVSLLSNLKKIDYDRLTPEEKTDFDILNDILSTVINGYDWRDYSALNPVNFLESPHVLLPYYVQITPFDTVGDYENYLNRLEAYPNEMDQLIIRFNKSIEKGHTYNNVSVSRVPGAIEGLLKGANNTNFILYKPFLDKLTNLKTVNDSRKVILRDRAETAVQIIIQKFRDLKSYLENVYFQHVRSGYGVSSWDNGGEFYKECLRWHLSLDLSPEEVHHKGLQEVERISSEMKKVLMKLNHQGSVKEFFDGLKNNSAYYFQTADEIIQWYKNALTNEINPKLSTLFKDIPDLPVDVKANPAGGISGQYVPGPADGSRPGEFLVNVNHPNKSLSITFMALLIHETNPGHHLQISVASNAKIPSYRKYKDAHFYNIPFEVPFYTAYIEGWALYAESLGEELNLYKTDYDLMGRYRTEIFRAARLVVDTGLHYFNWTRDQAMQYMLNHTSADEIMLAREIDRYITLPGQACAYKIGELKIKELRIKAQDELGTKFDIKDFHSTILKDGALPLSILEKNVIQWIAETKNKTTETKEQCISGSSALLTNLKLFLIICFALTVKSWI
ncbi:uncharacterized protein LOC133202363 [Saccostrea echinata]|uniref:uncharacterized protein LOC133202363 n=1 Tax=Saccostrea echinata TaxID=191078 RepID=UPI002A7F467F|nr:uncharacterized protein LOC133202363 [Saccostrea echinata]XP_061194162.1 uncharacterized protein LOC133202363 [Saccostrea echinata]